MFEFFPFSRFQRSDLQSSDPDPDKPQCRMSGSCGHFADLPVPSFAKDDLNPRRGDILSVPYGSGTGRENRFFAEQFDLSRFCPFILDHDAVSEFLQ